MKMNFLDYITWDRIEATFAKHGPIGARNQLGKYVKWILRDAKACWYAEIKAKKEADPDFTPPKPLNHYWIAQADVKISKVLLEVLAGKQQTKKDDPEAD